MTTIKITKISPQKNKDRVSLYSGETFITGIDNSLLVEFGLSTGMELDENLLTKLEAADEVKKALNKAYRFLSYRPRSEHEVLRKLSEKFPEEVVEKAVTKLKRLHYVDDKSFVSFWIEVRGNSRGPALLRSELLKKGIAKPLIDSALEFADREKMIEDALSLIKSKRRYRELDKEELYKKVAPFLARRGYGYEIIKEVISNLSEIKRDAH